MSLEKELALINIGYACFAIPKFRGQKEEFIGWLSKVERVFACCDLNDQEKFKVVISRLRGCALEWWNNYKFKRRSKGKEKVRTWKKLSSKLKGAFSPSTYMPMKEGISIKPTASFPSTPQKNQAPQKSLPSQPKPKPLSKSIPRCSKCQGFGHFVTDCPNSQVITLKEWKAVMEANKEEEHILEEEENKEEPKEVLKEEKEEEIEEASRETQEQIIIHADQRDILELPTTGSKHLSLFLTPIESTQENQFGESPNPSPNNILAISLSPHIFFLTLSPLKRKFCHKDKWKEPTLVL